MAKTKIVIIAGRKQSGKDTAAQFLIDYLNKEHSNLITKQYSFAQSLKEFLINVMGLTHDQCYGDNNYKNSLTNIKWDDLPVGDEKIIRLLLESRDPSKLKELKERPWLIHNGINYLYQNPTYMTAREVMQVFGSDICRKMQPDCWADATKKIIARDKHDYSFITDARFPNEIDLFLECEPIIIHLLRDPFKSQHLSEIALDNYQWDKIPNCITIDNRDIEIEVKHAQLLEAFKKYL